jgi:hypothetical protein
LIRRNNPFSPMVLCPAQPKTAFKPYITLALALSKADNSLNFKVRTCAYSVRKSAACC